MHYLFYTKSSKSGMYFALNSISQFGLGKFQVGNSHMWLLGTVLDSTGLSHTFSSHRKQPQITMVLWHITSLYY